jgi:NitT/TauT family transport system permease protein
MAPVIAAGTLGWAIAWVTLLATDASPAWQRTCLAGVVLGRAEWLERALRPVLVAVQVVPKVAFIPLFVIWFGFGMTSKIIIAAILAFFPIMLNVQLGVRSVDAGQREVMRSLNASKWQTFRHLELKSTMPYVFAGMEVGIVFAIIGTIVGEYLGGSEGLGYMVVRTLNELNAPALFAVIILLSALGLILYFGVNSLKRFFIPWHESVYGQHDANR